MENKDYKLILERLLDIMDEGVYIVDQDGVGIFYNRAMSDVEQISTSDVIGKEYHKAFPGVTQAESTMFQALKKGISTRNKRQSYKNLYGRNITTVNSTVPVKVGNRTIAAIEVAKDITALQSMSNTILELQEKDMGSEVEPPSIKRYSFDDLVGESPNFTHVIERAQKAANNDATVFIYGETGTGKELFAQSIHCARTALRFQNPFSKEFSLVRQRVDLQGLQIELGSLSRPVAELFCSTRSTPCLMNFRVSYFEFFKKCI